MPSYTRVPTTGLRQLAVSAPPAYWYERGLLWVFVNGQLPPFASPAGAVDYNSISNYLATDPNRLPAVKYQHALVSAADAPMSYFNNGEGGGGLSAERPGAGARVSRGEAQAGRGLTAVGTGRLAPSCEPAELDSGHRCHGSGRSLR